MKIPATTVITPQDQSRNAHIAVKSTTLEKRFLYVIQFKKKFCLSCFFFFFQDECSFVSLRDVERAMQVMVWFYNHVDILGRLMRNVIIEQRREEGDDANEDDNDVHEEVSLSSFLFEA